MARAPLSQLSVDITVILLSILCVTIISHVGIPQLLHYYNTVLEFRTGGDIPVICRQKLSIKGMIFIKIQTKMYVAYIAKPRLNTVKGYIDVYVEEQQGKTTKRLTTCTKSIEIFKGDFLHHTLRCLVNHTKWCLSESPE